MPDADNKTDITFPLGGVNVTGEFQEQPPGTTPVAFNVRGLNPDSLRERGGSRAGLKKYIPGPLFVGAREIQHLNVIVDPQGPNLGQSFEVPGPDWIPDPTAPGFSIPPGGWGWQTNLNAVPNDHAGRGRVIGIGILEGEGDGGGGPTTCDLIVVDSVDYMNAPPGEVEAFINGALVGPEFCECSSETQASLAFVETTVNLNGAQLQDEAYINDLLKTYTVAGVGTPLANDVIASINVSVSTPDGCSGDL